ncbi:hypothetical protein RZS08_00990, partial [Arthrospira platensis SPKY1]|nr:hypothetical protein [Arthrospira platensis SPKY1]
GLLGDGGGGHFAVGSGHRARGRTLDPDSRKVRLTPALLHCRGADAASMTARSDINRLSPAA